MAKIREFLLLTVMATCGEAALVRYDFSGTFAGSTFSSTVMGDPFRTTSPFSSTYNGFVEFDDLVPPSPASDIAVFGATDYAVDFGSSTWTYANDSDHGNDRIVFFRRQTDTEGRFTLTLNQQRNISSLPRDEFLTFQIVGSGTQIYTTTRALSLSSFQSGQVNGGISDYYTDVSTQRTAMLPTGFSTQAASVPEPASWFMMILGFGLVGAASRLGSAIRFGRPSHSIFALAKRQLAPVGSRFGYNSL